ncbi:hypothetical protein NIES267_65290 [Calothrix parasitica NIES-267]|uniref:Uncharacterized protein n=1 Tax=Calothrix parasitica NIES-267 TaxID=1973488 RepID=A0A1Z4M0W3_9CYAN|nr:hypothetical protein NIES267_65290 [Calothrix parasitica NIES-267]
MSTRNFKRAYNQLEMCMKDLANKNDEIYVPNIVPDSPADYIFICMEPSLGEWAKNRDEAESKLRDGFTNFLDGFNTMVLHFAIRNYLCQDNQTYHLTDLSKGAMLVKDADNNRIERYENWYPLLLHEMNLIASTNVKVFAIGSHVVNFLQKQQFPWDFTQLIHYSGQAVSHWDRVVKEREEDFKRFKDTVTHEDFLNNAKSVIESSKVPLVISESVLKKMCKSNLTLSRFKLMFNYKLIFDAVRSLG